MLYLLMGDKRLDEEVLENTFGFSHLQVIRKIVYLGYEMIRK